MMISFKRYSYYLIFLCLSFSLWNCESEVLPENPLIITTHDNYNERQFYLTNESGDILEQGMLLAGETINLKTHFENNKQYDLSFVNRSVNFNGDVSVFISTFLDVRPFNFLIDREWGLNEVYGSVSFKKPPANLINFRPVTVSRMEDQNDYLTLKFLTPSRESRPLYISWQEEGQLSKKYLFYENKPLGFQDTIDYSVIPVIENPILFTFPQGGSVIDSKVYGGFNVFPEISYLLSNKFVGLPPIHFIPDNLFDYYISTSYIHFGDYIYHSRRKTMEIVPDYISPNLEIELVNEDPNDLRFTSFSDYDFFEADFRFDGGSVERLVLWEVIGKGGAVVEFSLPKSLEKIIAQDFLGFSFQKSELSAIQIVKCQGISSYEDYLLYKESTILNENLISWERFIRLY